MGARRIAAVGQLGRQSSEIALRVEEPRLRDPPRRCGAGTLSARRGEAMSGTGRDASQGKDGAARAVEGGRGAPDAPPGKRPDRRPEAPATDDAAADEPWVVPIGDAFDLHAFAPRDVRAAVDAYLEAACERGLREVRLIHGRGRGVQRAQVRRQLAADARVLRFADAPHDRGGWGATIVWLRLAEGETHASDGN